MAAAMSAMEVAALPARVAVAVALGVQAQAEWARLGRIGKVEALAAQGVHRHYRRGALLIQEGDVGDTLYIVLKGRLRAYVADATGKELTLGVYGPLEYVGEMSLDGGPRSASVITLEVPNDQVKNYGIVVADKEGRVTSFQEKPSPEEAKSNLASTGIYIFEPQVLDLIPPGREFDIGSELFPLLAEKGLPFYAQSRYFNWIDIGRVSDYWAVCMRVLRGEVAQMDMPGTEVRPGVWVGLGTRVDWDTVNITGPVYIGSGTEVESGVTIEGPAWIGHGSRLRKNSKVVRSVLFEYTRLSEGGVFFEVVASPQYCVDRNGKTTYQGDETTSLRWGDARA